MDKMKEITKHEISGDASQPAVLEVFWGRLEYFLTSNYLWLGMRTTGQKEPLSS